MSRPKPLKILIHAMDATGHLMACVGLAQALAARHHHVVFLLNSKFKGQYLKYGFDEYLLEQKTATVPLKPVEDDPNAEPETPEKKRAKAILSSGLLSGKSTLEKIKDSIELADGFGQQMLNLVIDFNPQIAQAIKEHKPDLFILDHFMIAPAILESGVPWVGVSSSNPIGTFKSDDLPPSESGYPLNSDRALWTEFRVYKNEFAARFRKYHEKLFQHFNYPYTEDNLPKPGYCSPPSKWCIYGYPKELDYHDVIPIDEEKFIRVDAFCRQETEDPEFKLPDKFTDGTRKIIYFSLGSVGSYDVELIKKITGFLAKTEYLVIVSKGPLADEYELPENCWGQANLPQTWILPLVDLVITHGGNNTVTEAFSFGKPMIVMPMFAEQGDNGQRIMEKGFGVRLNPYEVKEKEFLEAVKKVMEDVEMKKKLEAAKKRIQADNSKEKMCKKLEALVEKFKKN